jgi:transcriptional antiterminator
MLLYLVHGRETWVLTKKSPQNVESAEMKFHRLVKSCTRLDKLSNHDLRSELEMCKVTEKIQINNINWLQYMERMEDYRLSKCVLDCQDGKGT